VKRTGIPSNLSFRVLEAEAEALYLEAEILEGVIAKKRKEAKEKRRLAMINANRSFKEGVI